MNFPADIPIPEEVLGIARRLEAAGHSAWCVGGALRDTLLGDPQSDFDLATSATPDQVQALFSRTVAVGIKYGTVGVVDRHGALHEVTTFRRDVATDGRHAEVAYGVSLDEDLARRDFTINAIAYHPLRGEWRDPFEGAEDLTRRRIRAVGDAASRFREDYLRVLRALRFAARFEFAIDPETWTAARGASSGLKGLSAERVRDEWFKGLRSARSLRRLVSLWQKSGASDIWIPEMRPFDSPASVLAQDSPEQREPVVLTVLLCTDAVAVLERLRASNVEVARAAALMAGPGQPDGLTEVPVRRWLAAVGAAGADLETLWQLRHGRACPWASVADQIRRRGDPLTRGDLAITGRDLLQAGVPAGPGLGRVLERLLGLVVDDPSLNTRETLLARAKEPE
jgi:tRNA nucleotidyltransferase (CCA-adding enzyme)